MNRVTRSSRPVRLAVQTLEARDTPSATVDYTGLNRTLTVTATSAEDITVAPMAGKPTGFITVTDKTNTVIFRSIDAPLPAVNSRLVRTLNVRFDGVTAGTLTLDPGTKLGASLNVFGAKTTQTVTVAGTIGGSFTYTPKGGQDTINIEAGVHVGNKADLKLGSGADVVRLKGGFIGGNLIVDTGTSGDTVELLEGGDLYVAGTASIPMGTGANTLIAKGAHTLEVGKGLTISGDRGADTVTLRSIDANSFDATLRVHGDASGDDFIELHRNYIAAGLDIRTLGGADQVSLADKRWTNVPPHTALGTGVPAYVCPADGRVRKPQYLTTHDRTVAFTSYLGVSGIDRSRPDGSLYPASAVSIAHVTDGASNTLLVGERPPSSALQFGWWYAGEGVDKAGTADLFLGVREIGSTRGGVNCPDAAYRFQAGDVKAPCDYLHFWSVHAGGANFLFVDGSVRFLTYAAESVIAQLATAHGGEVVDLP